MLENFAGSHKRMLLVMICCGITACATTKDYKESLDGWKGKSEAELTESWGAPIDVFNSNVHKFLVYQVRQTERLESLGPRSSGSYEYSKELACTTVFDVVDGRVVDWAIKGNNCKK